MAAGREGNVLYYPVKTPVVKFALVAASPYQEIIMKGKCWKFGDNINTDEIIPARYLNTIDAKELAHCMERCRSGFIKKAGIGDVIVAGDNFGCGSSREHAPIP